MIKEVCVGSYRDIEPAIRAGANRVELNTDLLEGGITPSFGVIDQAAKLCRKNHIPIIVMLRPRAGNFVYSNDEFMIMLQDLKQISLLNVDGVAFGCLKENGTLDKTKMAELLRLTSEMSMTSVVHMAFDEIPFENQEEELNWLIRNGAKRLLTHGGNLNISIEETLPRLKQIIKMAKNRIEILPGGGINYRNVNKIMNNLRVTQAHGSRIVKY